MPEKLPGRQFGVPVLPRVAVWLPWHLLALLWLVTTKSYTAQRTWVLVALFAALFGLLLGVVVLSMVAAPCRLGVDTHKLEPKSPTKSKPAPPKAKAS